MLAEIMVAKQVKPWADMNKEERKKRIRTLWMKVRMFVRIRRSIKSLRNDVDKREILEMLQ